MEFVCKNMKKEGIVQYAFICILLFVSLFSVLSCSNTSNDVAASSAPKCDTLRIAFTGDILLDRGVRKYIERYNVDSLFTPEIDSVFAANDFVIGNLECPATSVVSPINKRFIFRGEPDWLQALYEHGFTHLNMANNHSMDQGRQGLADTEKQIRNNGMIPLGYGTTIAESIKPKLISECPRKVYLITSLRVPSENWTYLDSVPSVSESDFATIEAQIDSLKRIDTKCFVIVMLHWGVEHVEVPSSYQVLDAHRLVQAGADCIVGHHPHCLQTVETYKGVPIYYSIGNFIFDQKKPINTRTAILTAEITADTAYFALLPVEIEDCVPRLIGEQ